MARIRRLGRELAARLARDAWTMSGKVRWPAGGQTGPAGSSHSYSYGVASNRSGDPYQRETRAVASGFFGTCIPPLFGFRPGLRNRSMPGKAGIGLQWSSLRSRTGVKAADKPECTSQHCSSTVRRAERNSQEHVLSQQAAIVGNAGTLPGQVSATSVTR